MLFLPSNWYYIFWESFCFESKSKKVSQYGQNGVNTKHFTFLGLWYFLKSFCSWNIESWQDSSIRRFLEVLVFCLLRRRIKMLLQKGQNTVHDLKKWLRRSLGNFLAVLHYLQCCKCTFFSWHVILRQSLQHVNHTEDILKVRYGSKVPL